MEEFRELYYRGFKFMVGSKGNVKYLKMDKNRSLHTNSSGYASFTKGNKIFLVHRMIAMAFIPNPHNKSQVNHKNGNKKDNSIENLEWVTKSENELHSVRILNHKRNINGLKNNWENPIHTKKIQAIMPDGKVKIFKSQTECAKYLNMSKSYVTSVIKNIIKKNPYQLKTIIN